jgi:hypothetical protein
MVSPFFKGFIIAQMPGLKSKKMGFSLPEKGMNLS